jgi:hypothetical protein
MGQTMDRERTSAAPRGRERAQALVAQLEEVSRFFPSTSGLARAVGVTRDTILAWRLGDTSRVRRANETRVAQLLEVCLAAAEHLPEDKQVGRWMEAPQTFLYGGTPIGLLADGGDPAFLLQSMEPPVASMNETALRALASADGQLAELVAPERRRPNTEEAVEQASAGVVDLMEALRRSVAEEQQTRSRRSKGPRVVTVKRRDGGWVNMIDGRVVMSAWRTKRRAVQSAKRLAAAAGLEQVTIEDAAGAKLARRGPRAAAKAAGTSRSRR